MLNGAQHPPPHPVLAFAKTSLSFAKERDVCEADRVRFAIHPVMLSAAKHPHRTGFLALARNDTFAFVMLSEVKHPCAGFLTVFGMIKKSVRNDRATSPCFGVAETSLSFCGEGLRFATGCGYFPLSLREAKNSYR